MNTSSPSGGEQNSAQVLIPTTPTEGTPIVCPSWCTETREKHTAELDDYEGGCLHDGAHVAVDDTSRGPGVDVQASEARPAETVHVILSLLTDPTGHEESTPSVSIIQAGDVFECSVAQALELADALRAVVETYREAAA